MTNTTWTPSADLHSALFNPRFVALVGASDDATKTAGRPQQYLARAGFSGTVYPINPNRETVQGTKAYPSLSALPEVPDHVFVLSPTASVLPVVEECGRLGVKLVTILASGFSEVGPEGAALEAAVRAAARAGGVRLVGPSSIGVVNPRNGLVLTANAAFAEPNLPKGGLFVASHSGSMIGALVSRGIARGVGFAGLVSVGSETDLSLGEICSASLDDDGIEGYLLFLESMHHGQDLKAFAIEAGKRGKPVVVYKLGRSDAAAEMAATHTGALAGEDDVADALLKDCGVARVGVVDALLECAPLAKRIPITKWTRAPHVGVVTTTGGGAAMAVDQLGIRNVTVQPPSEETLQKLRDKGISVSSGRVVDLTLAGVKYEVMKAALDVLLEAPEFDLVLATIGSSARFQPQLAVKPIIDSIHHTTPLAAMMVPDAPEALAALTAAGVPCFRGPEGCAESIAAVFSRRSTGAVARLEPPSIEGVHSISEAEAYRVLDALGVPHAPAVTAPLSGPAPTLPFDYPVVAKVCSAQIQHKTELGGVVLGINSGEQLQAAMQTLRANLNERAPDVECDEVLVQPMRKGLTEVLIGYKIDADAGPIIMLAAGGIWAEVARDRSIRLAPVSIETAKDMVLEVKSLKIVSGLRGKERGDLEALAKAVAALSQLATRPDLKIREAEVNPLMVMPEGQGVMAVDALILQGR
jgi:acetate---CoA ligase (ADP-forming)